MTMTKTILLLPLAASLLLGTAAFAQGQMNDRQMPQNGMQNGMMHTTMSPRQSMAGGMPIDQETSINGIQAACTGVGDMAENRARWNSYPVKLVVAGNRGQFYAGEHVSISSRNGRHVAEMTCNGPWVLMRLQPGNYRATVDLPGHGTKQISFTAPARGQHEVTVHFAANDVDMGRDRNRAIETDYRRPQPKPMNDDRMMAPNSGPQQH